MTIITKGFLELDLDNITLPTPNVADLYISRDELRFVIYHNNVLAFDSATEQATLDFTASNLDIVTLAGTFTYIDGDLIDYGNTPATDFNLAAYFAPQHVIHEETMVGAVRMVTSVYETSHVYVHLLLEACHHYST
ncbi:MAG: hypothetical protein HRU18_28315, partial [Pseudoalteromonas sp.]|uniref:hypothetical protein n=1 Tax=Pseudoalteromonas sp. TaxID=53249 RepID=UPI001D7218A8